MTKLESGNEIVGRDILRLVLRVSCVGVIVEIVSSDEFRCIEDVVGTGGDIVRYNKFTKPGRCLVESSS